MNVKTAHTIDKGSEMKFRELLEAKKPKVGVIVAYNRRKTRWIGTVEELTSSFSYTLEVGHSYKHEKGNKSINLKPKTIKALAKELEKSLGNSGNSGSYDYADATPEEVSRYMEEGEFEINESLNESTKVSANGIVAMFNDKIDDKDVKKLLNAYDTQTWAIDSYPTQKKADANNKTIITMLAELGKGSITFKTGPSKIERVIKF